MHHIFMFSRYFGFYEASLVVYSVLLFQQCIIYIYFNLLFVFKFYHTFKILKYIVWVLITLEKKSSFTKLIHENELIF
jgi:hypothetical protein